MEQVAEIVASVLKKDVAFVQENLTTENLWNSLTRVEIIMTIEEELDVLFEPDEIKRVTTVQALMDIVGDKL